jgi:hypothetical protein
MSPTDWREQLPFKVGVMQIIIGGLALGCVFFLMIAVLAGLNFQNAAPATGLTYIALATAGVILVLWSLVPGIVVSQGRKKILQSPPISGQTDDKDAVVEKQAENSLADALVQLLQTKTIIACAMLEGVIFFLLIAYMIERSSLSIIAAVALLILLLAHMPTIGRVAAWVEKQMRLVSEERSLI